MTILKVYRNQTNLIGQIYEIVPPLGVTAYLLQLDSPVNGRSWPASIPVAPGTTSLKFFVDSTFPGEVWSLSTILRGDELSFYSSSDPSTRVGWVDLPTTGGGGQDTNGGFPEAPTDGQLYGRKSSAWNVVPPPGSGPQGIPGVKGDKGDQGIQGIQGVPGQNGTGSGGGLASYLNVMDYGATGSGDDAAHINAAAAAARAFGGENQRPGLYFPPGHTFTIGSQIDLTGIRLVRAEGIIHVGYTPTTGPAIICRAASSDAGAYIFFRQIDGNDVYGDLKQPYLLLSGFHASYIHVMYCQYVRIEGDRLDSTYASFAYNEVHYGIVYRHEIGDSAQGTGFAWVNENSFFGGDAAHVRIGGAWRTNTALFNSNGKVGVTCPNHGYLTGQIVEVYGSHQYAPPSNTIADLITVIDANNYVFQNAPWQTPPQGGPGQSMGPPAYPHNHNCFYSPDIEADVNVILNDVTSNMFKNSRLEAQWGSLIAFGPNALGNFVEQSSMAQHGSLPTPHLDNIDGHITVKNFNPGKNWTGWMWVPKNWGDS